MKIKEPFLINSISYSKDELIAFSFKALESGKMADWESDIYQFILAFFDEEVTLSQQSSGTTGDPKSIDLHRDSMVNSAKKTIEFFKLLPGDNVLLCLPVQYIAGKMMIVRALVGRLNLITAEPSGNPISGLNIPIQFAAMVPLQVYESVKKPDSFKKIGKLIIGGGEINQALLDEIRKLKGTEVFESFAMSETYTHFALRRLNMNKHEAEFCVFKGVQISTDSRGCLQVDIPGITNGPIQSNDLVKITNQQRFNWLGRIDNVINSGGKKIIPEILEARIRSIINHELLLVGVRDEKLGQRLVLVVEIDPKHAPVESWRESLIQMFPKHEVPKEIRCLIEFPRTRSMKVDRLGVMELIKKSLIQSKCY